MPSLYSRLLGSPLAVVALLPFLPIIANAGWCPSLKDVENQLGKHLTPGSTISTSTNGVPRWSLYGAPNPAFIVNVFSEIDVATTIHYCNKNDLNFVVQNQGNGWADTFHLDDCGLLINIAGLNKITFSPDKTAATIQGGTLVNDMIFAAYGNNTRFAIPTCTCLGFLGASLGGGLTRVMGLYGILVDQITSVKLVTAQGRLLHVDATHHSELWYAIRGAAPNFGVVTSAVVNAYPTPQAQNVAWQGAITFSDDKLEALIQALYDLVLQSTMEIDLLFSFNGPPLNKVTITVIPFFLGNASAAEEAFASILKLGPTTNGATEVPYTHWGDFGQSFCQKGMRKPAYGVSVSRQVWDPSTWRAVYNDLGQFVREYPQAANSSILAEYYPVQKAVQIGSDVTSSYPFRDVPIHIVVIPTYADSSLDGAANAFGARARDLLRSADGLVNNSTYINFAHGDETLEEIYGKSLPRLQVLKKRYDPRNRFNQWFPLA
ncbi:MAG: hypothetical protein Q9195_004984 [Heterodermia aff. obscurata]